MPARRPPVVATANRRVLVVDDEDDVRESTCMVLESLDCEPIPISDAGDVLPMAAEHQPGLILQDLKMPRLNVAGVVAALRSEPATADIPIVFFSANADIATTAKRYNVWGFLRKPFTPAALKQVIDQVFGAKPEIEEDPRKTIRDVFHEQWNVLASVSNYAHLLRERGDEETQRIAKNLEGQLLRLEATIDRLHVFVSVLADRAMAAQVAEPEEEVEADAETDVQADERPRHSRPPRPMRDERPIDVHRAG